MSRIKLKVNVVMVVKATVVPNNVTLFVEQYFYLSLYYSSTIHNVFSNPCQVVSLPNPNQSFYNLHVIVHFCKRDMRLMYLYKVILVQKLQHATFPWVADWVAERHRFVCRQKEN